MHLDLGTTVDRYVVEGRIGQGGVASVYRVRHSGLGTVHALKVVHVPSPAITERLLREGRVQGQLRHPNAVAVTDLVSVRGAPGLVMELVPGASLDRCLRHCHPSLDEADLLARGLLAGVAAAHRIGLVHRDLKPGNVLLEVADGQVIPKIVDFGLAKVLSTESESPIATRAGASMGTPAYMAPEQIADASTVDERADVFALGAILYELVTGERAFAADSVPEVYDRIRAGDHGPIPDDLPARMRAAITGALETDLEARLQSVVELQRKWVDRTDPPRITWSAQALDAAGAASTEVAAPSAHTPSSSTFAGAEQTTHETWTGDGLDLGSTLPDTTAPARSERRARWWLAGVLGLVGIGAVVAWMAQPEPLPVLTPQRTVEVSDDPALQRQFDEAWAAWLGGDFAEAERRLRAVRDGEPDEPMPHFLASSALMFQGDVPQAIEAMTTARSLVTHGADGPGAPLVAVYQELQDRTVSVGEPLDDYLTAHPDDYLARVLGAQYCSTTSEVEVCEHYHRGLLDHDSTQVVAHVAIASSWHDLGELDRARAAIDDGLAIDPAEPGLLALEGSTWLAEGAVEEARSAFERALEADPSRRGPKLSLATIGLIADDGSFERVTAELLAPTVPASSRVSVHTSAARTLQGLGRVEEALVHVAAAEAIERDEGTPLGLLTAMSARGGPLGLREDVAGQSELIEEELAVIARSPEIPNPVRNRFAAYAPMVAGIRAAQSGDRKRLEDALERVRGAEIPQPGVIERLEREAAVLDRDADAIRQSVVHLWTECDRQMTLGLLFERAEFSDEALEAWEGVLDAPCRVSGPERANRVRALVGLAEATEDAERRASLLAEVDALWTRPDPDLPLAKRIEALRLSPDPRSD